MKKIIRRQILKKRDGMSAGIKAEKDSRIKDRFFSLPEFIAAEKIFFYASFR